MSNNNRHRLLSRTFVGLVATALVLIGGIAILFLLRFAPSSERTLSELRAEGFDIVSQLEAYKIQHGVYPLDLESAQIIPPSHIYGHWCYATTNDQLAFVLWTYMHNHPGLGYDPKTGSFVVADDSGKLLFR